MRANLAAGPLLGLLIGAIWLAMPADAPARETYVLPAGHETVFRLPATNGYELTIYSGARYLLLDADGPGARNRYSVRGRRLGRYGVQANLPGFGAIAARFAPTSPKRQLRPYRACDGPGPKVQKGVVRGRIEFIGEGDYTDVLADRAEAEVLTWTRQTCRYLEYHRPKHPRISASFLAESSGEQGVAFEATRFVPGVHPAEQQILFEASSDGPVGRVRVFRSVFAVASASAFRFPDGMRNPEHVIFEPPSPFSGTGTLQRTAESTYSWECSLSVQFPGVGQVPLTGPQFRLDFCALRGCIDQSTPEEEEEEFLHL